jgi:hypothetical protein
MILNQARLWVPGVNARWPTVHEKEDHTFGLCRKVRLPERLNTRRIWQSKQLVLGQQASQAERSKSASSLTQHGAPRERLVCVPVFEIDQESSKTSSDQRSAISRSLFQR